MGFFSISMLALAPHFLDWLWVVLLLPSFDSMNALIRIKLINCILSFKSSTTRIPFFDIWVLLGTRRSSWAHHLAHWYIVFRSSWPSLIIRLPSILSRILRCIPSIILLIVLIIVLEASEAVTQEGAEGTHAGRGLGVLPALGQLIDTNLMCGTIDITHLLLRDVRGDIRLLRSIMHFLSIFDVFTMF